jgi:hypothetical protein
MSWEKETLSPGKVPCIVHPKLTTLNQQHPFRYFENYRNLVYNGRYYRGVEPVSEDHWHALARIVPLYSNGETRRQTANALRDIMVKIGDSLGFEDYIILMSHYRREYVRPFDDDEGLFHMDFRFARDEDRTLWEMIFQNAKPTGYVGVVAIQPFANQLGVWSDDPRVQY